MYHAGIHTNYKLYQQTDPYTNGKWKIVKQNWEGKHTQDTAFDSGGSPVPVGVKSSNSGRVRGSSVSGRGTLSPLSSKKLTGIGSPQ